MARKCGTCTLCCTAMAVPELDKPNGVRCKATMWEDLTFELLG